MNKSAPNRYDNEGFSQYQARLIDLFPKSLRTELSSCARGTKRIRRSSYTPHYGDNAAARNLRHLAAGTHGFKEIQT